MAQLPGATPSVLSAHRAAEGRPDSCSAVTARAVSASIAGRSLPLLLPREERAGKPLLGLGAPYRMEATASSRKLWCSLQKGLAVAFAGDRLESSAMRWNMEVDMEWMCVHLSRGTTGRQ